MLLALLVVVVGAADITGTEKRFALLFPPEARAAKAAAPLPPEAGRGRDA